MKRKADCTPEEWRALLDKQKLRKRKRKLKADYTPEEWREYLDKAKKRRANMTEEQKQRKKEYDKMYCEKNKDKISFMHRVYREKHKNELSKKTKSIEKKIKM